ncbi:MAG: Flp pilus assembly complex ATPase component TadA [Candidatus Omnitrophica bacterium]|nr:Flp pilus assembly complex ATPase component TadA [Candidatus Omnitrophota bacterium]
MLIEKGIITPEQLETALKKQKETGGLLGAILLESGFVDEETVFLPTIAGQLGIDFVRLKDRNIPPEVIHKIPPKFASHYKVMPVQWEEGTLTIATTQPLEMRIFDELGLIVNAKLKCVLASEKDIHEAIRRYYGVGAETIAQMMDTVQPQAFARTEVSNIEEIDSEASIGKFLNQILLEAYKDRATDVHIEPFEDELQIRYRVDGVLYDARVPKNIKHFKDSIISRIKVLSNLNIAEKRVPQDGRFKVRVGDTDLDLRVSFLPTPYGESVVLRILNAARLFNLEELGLAKNERAILENLIKKPHGVVFITGPTGSGKTTTLYSCLSQINTGKRKIITIEDPVEYQLKGITQIQIHPAVGLTFASGLRSMLRHDPDVMMVGEVRDMETAEIAIQAALTGHLIFSTLHTNDAASGVTRLLDMGVEPYLLTSTVECFIAQRLVRMVCGKCRRPARITPELVRDFAGEVDIAPGTAIYEHQGCEACGLTGYSGRQAIYEFLVCDEEIRQLIMGRAGAGEIRKKAVARGMRTLRQAGWEKVKNGLTTPQEVLRVTQEE